MTLPQRKFYSSSSIHQLQSQLNTLGRGRKCNIHNSRFTAHRMQGLLLNIVGAVQHWNIAYFTLVRCLFSSSIQFQNKFKILPIFIYFNEIKFVYYDLKCLLSNHITFIQKNIKLNKTFFIYFRFEIFKHSCIFTRAY